MKTSNETWCIESDSSTDMKIWGMSETEPHKRLDISFRPCTPVVSRDISIKCAIPNDSPASYKSKL